MRLQGVDNTVLVRSWALSADDQPECSKTATERMHKMHAGAAPTVFPKAPTPNLPAPVKLALAGVAALAAAEATRLCSRQLMSGSWASGAALVAGWYGLCAAKNKLFGARPDGVWVRDATLMRRMTPYVMQGRNCSRIDYGYNYKIKKALRFIERWNDEHPAPHQHITLFHVAIAAMLRANLLHPGLNRFVRGNQVFERNELSISFAVKSARKAYAALRTAKFRAQVDESFLDTVERLNRAIDGERAAGGRNASEKEMAFFLRLPGPVLSAAFKVQAFLDDHGLWPGCLIAGDPLYASIFAANLGSLHPTAMRDVSHHLYEYGTVSLFATLCSAQLEGADPTLRINWTFDERVNDAHYCLKPLEVGRELIENPHKLLEPLTENDLVLARLHDSRAGRDAVRAEAERR